MFDFIKESMAQVKEMKNLDLSQEFTRVKERLLMEWKNHYLEQTYNQLMPIVDAATQQPSAEPY